MGRIDNAVFVDRYGRRRKAVIGVGLTVSALLIGWLLFIGVGVAAVVALGGGIQSTPVR